MKKKLICLVLILCGCLPLVAQHKPIEKIDKDGVYLATDIMPEFPGGITALFNFLKENIKYPAEAHKNNIQGRVIIQFVIVEDGSLEMVKVARSVDPLLDAEALRVVKTMPKWKPGIEKGVPVKVRFTIPVMFNLSKQLRGFLLPIDEKISNKTLEGVWQSCTIQKEENNYRVMLAPIIKMLLPDKTFMNLFIGNVQISAAVLTKGQYEMKSDYTYVETIGQALGEGPFTAGAKNEITFEFLNDKLIKFTFKIPGREELWTEYWFRIPKPGDSGYASTSSMAN